MLQKKKNRKINTLNKSNNYIKTKKNFNSNIFKVNKNELLLINKYRLSIIFSIIINNLR